MERYGDTYTLVIANADKLEDREVQLESSITSYFHADGYLAESKFRTHVQKLLSQDDSRRPVGCLGRAGAAAAPGAAAMRPAPAASCWAAAGGRRLWRPGAQARLGRTVFVAA
ncbi:hypothetical protein MNEG_9820 [Monoraphidium neglectum]|uniref:Signal peptidase complex subunit 2 n=1 Tax=Monoraphidium neglectum TaxID=145388 RepID=A0A0D2JF89_9CHLO|nr:hypothetical protein MNEG_9820 [Monoraphidium neglectum]KIY98142.1 hypothetical protein MNEG_9820 [Monoraphidium neglectum]|eukprot:XP_013897162.1 hypothetical protein MNEG_9820 [Monoraphidium neglectum]